MRTRRLLQVDVFSAEPLLGNPVAVVVDGDGLTSAQMQRLASWTNLSETVFLLPPTTPAADYRVWIFTIDGELPFAGHPTIGSTHAWLEAGGRPRTPGTVVQECAVGLVTVRRTGGRWAFAAPPLTRYEPVDAATLARAAAALRVEPGRIEGASWLVNGPTWIGVRLSSAEEVLDLRPDPAALDGMFLGVVGPHAPGPPGAPAFEVRGLMGTGQEDPVTGSLNAGLARWLIDTGVAQAPYVAAQGTVLGRAGRVHVTEADGRLWVGGDATTVISGTVVASSRVRPEDT